MNYPQGNENKDDIFLSYLLTFLIGFFHVLSLIFFPATTTYINSFESKLLFTESCDYSFTKTKIYRISISQ